MSHFIFIFLAVFSSLAWNSAQAVNYSVTDTAYNFVDISPTGTGSGVELIAGCDDCGRGVDLGFEFTYYGRVYSQMYVVSNGFVIPGLPSDNSVNLGGCCHGGNIQESPTGTVVTPDNLVGVIAPWWTDLSLKAEAASSAPEENGKIYTALTGSSGAHIFIVQYDQVRHFHNLATDDANTFQIKFFQVDNRIEFHYKKILANTNLHTIGIESPRQDEGIKYFRTGNSSVLPLKSENFAITFTAPEPVKITSAVAYSAQGNIFKQTFVANTSVASAGDIAVKEPSLGGSLVKTIDNGNPELISSNPAKFSLKYELHASLKSEKAGVIGSNIIDVTLNNLTHVVFDSQVVLMKPDALIPAGSNGDKAFASVLNETATMDAFKTTANIKNSNNKDTQAADVFLRGRDPGTNLKDTHLLTALSGTQKCGPPALDVDNGELADYLYVLCHSGNESDALEIVVTRFDVTSYLSASNTGVKLALASTKSSFDGDVEATALMAAANGSYAYAKDAGAGNAFQDVYLVNSSGVEAPVNSVSGVLKSLVMDSSGTKLVYVIDSSVYYFDGSAEVIVNTAGVTSATISSDGSLIAFNSSGDIATPADNGDGSVEIYTVASATPMGAKKQRTNLPAGKVCKLPQLSSNGKRLMVVCDGDQLDLGNDFTDRQAVFLFDERVGDEQTYLLTGLADKVSSIDQLVLSGNGSAVIFNDGTDNQSFFLNGLSDLSPLLNTFTASPAKPYPVPFVLPGSGKSGSFNFGFMILLFLSVFSKLKLRKNVRRSNVDTFIL